MNKKVIILSIILITSFVSFFYTKKVNELNSHIDNVTNENSNEILEGICNRTERLENDPEYDRALSLINQRIDENEKWCDKYCESEEYEKKLRFRHFPANLTNCIKIIEQDIPDKAEGYFIFNGEDIKKDYFPIIVNKSYNYSDDILTALLITHEMTHVQQYLDSLSSEDNLSCREKEVEAFISQIDFYVLLNNEENKSVWLKMNESNNKKHSQIEMLLTMININKTSTCEFSDDECKQKNLKSKLFELISENENYQDQCNL